MPRGNFTLLSFILRVGAFLNTDADESLGHHVIILTLFVGSFTARLSAQLLVLKLTSIIQSVGTEATEELGVLLSNFIGRLQVKVIILYYPIGNFLTAWNKFLVTQSYDPVILSIDFSILTRLSSVLSNNLIGSLISFKTDNS